MYYMLWFSILKCRNILFCAKTLEYLEHEVIYFLKCLIVSYFSMSSMMCKKYMTELFIIGRENYPQNNVTVINLKLETSQKLAKSY